MICHGISSYDFLIRLIDFPELRSIIGFNMSNRYSKKYNFFCLSFYKHNYSVACFFPGVLSAANSIANHIDFILIVKNILQKYIIYGLT